MTARLSLSAALMLTTMALPACTSRDEKAANAAAIAADAFQNGDLVTARKQVGTSLSLRDDIGDVWLLSGRIALAMGDLGSALSSYENVLTLDRSNVEALTRVCQLSISGNDPVRAERYAGQLLALQPGNAVALNVQAAAALVRGDKPKASALLDQALKIDPQDPTALITRSRLLSQQENYPAAAEAAEASLAAGGDRTGRLRVLLDIYVKDRDVAGYRRTIARIAEANPRDPDALLALARTRYDAGDAAGGFAATRRVLAARPGDVARADAVLHLWLAQGSGAMPATAVAAARGQPLETRAAYASFANAMGRPADAMALLGTDAAGDAPTSANANAKAARADAEARLGQPEAAAAAVAAILAVDPDQPRALGVRASLRASAGDTRGAMEDLRHLLTASPADADARLRLVDLMVANGDGILARGVLRDGIDDPDPDPRLVTRLAAMLRRGGRGDDAKSLVSDFVRDHPFARHPAA